MSTRQSSVSFGIALFPWGQSPPSFDELAKTAQLAEELGYDAIHIPFHLVLPRVWIFPSFKNNYLLDTLTLISALASRTKRIRLSINCIVPPLYNPYVCAKIVSTLDVISGGRVIFGSAVGWIKTEFKIVGASYDKRGNVTDEYLELIKRLWSEDEVSHNGKYVKLEHVKLEPKPIQRPHPPIWIGGGAHSIERASKYADMLCLYCKDLHSTAEIPEIAAGLKRESEKYKRSVGLSLFTFASAVKDSSEEEKALSLLHKMYEGYPSAAYMSELSIVGDPDACLRSIEKLSNAGISYFVLDFNSHGLEPLSKLEEQMPRFKENVIGRVG